MSSGVALSTITGSPYTTSSSTNQAATGNFLCWGSNTNLGTVLFRVNLVPNTHARQLCTVGWFLERTAVLDNHPSRLSYHPQRLRPSLPREQVDLLEYLFVVPSRPRRLLYSHVSHNTSLHRLLLASMRLRSSLKSVIYLVSESHDNHMVRPLIDVGMESLLGPARSPCSSFTEPSPRPSTAPI